MTLPFQVIEIVAQQATDNRAQVIGCEKGAPLKVLNAFVPKMAQARARIWP
jgi:hypothetical protein